MKKRRMITVMLSLAAAVGAVMPVKAETPQVPECRERVPLNPYIESNQPEDARRLREFVKEYLDAFDNRDFEKFKGYYKSGNSLGVANTKGLDELIADMERNPTAQYSIKGFPIVNHGAKPHVYGMTVGFYGPDDKAVGYSFLLLDLSDPETVVNHISTYQTAAEAEQQGVFTLDDFFVP